MNKEEIAKMVINCYFDKFHIQGRYIFYLKESKLLVIPSESKLDNDNIVLFMESADYEPSMQEVHDFVDMYGYGLTTFPVDLDKLLIGGCI